MATRKKILVYADDPGWAYDNIAKCLQDFFKEEYDWYYDYTYCHRYFARCNYYYGLKTDVINLVRFVFRVLTFRPLTNLSLNTFLNHKLTFFWQRKFLKNDKVHTRRVLPFYKQYDLAICLDYYFDRHAHLTFRSKKLIKGIYFDSFPPIGCQYDYRTKRNPRKISSISAFAAEYLSDIDALAGGSPTIVKRYSSFVKNSYFCNAFRGEDLFKEKLIQLKSINDELIIGWTGNPNRPFKHFYTIIEPVVNSLIEEGLNIELRTQFSGTYESLAKFYTEVDIIMIASEQDAGPFMFAEASLCGVPAISTAVGFPAHVIDHMTNGIIVKLDQSEFKENIKLLYNNRDLLFNMSNRIRQDYLKKMGSHILRENWKKMLNTVGI